MVSTGSPQGQGEGAEPGGRKFWEEAGGMKAGRAWLVGGGWEEARHTQATASF